MSNGPSLFTCVSWEDRFRLGLEQDVKLVRPGSVCAFFYDCTTDWTADNRVHARKICEEHGIRYDEVMLSASDRAANWRQLQYNLTVATPADQAIHLNISTMPRELIWTSFWSTVNKDRRVTYSYNSPQAYNQEWLSRDPDRPRLVYKLGGVARLERRTALVVVTGYDLKRTAELIRFYEPEKSYIGLQVGNANAGNGSRMDEQREHFKRYKNVELFDIDAYADDRGEAVLSKIVGGIAVSHNVILSSLGPKLSAVAMYQIHRKFDEVGIAYAPSREFNREYSSGLGARYSGTVPTG